MTKLLYLTSLRRDRVESGPVSILKNLQFLDEGRIVWQNGIIMNYFGVANMFWSTNQMVNGESYHNICQKWMLYEFFTMCCSPESYPGEHLSFLGVQLCSAFFCLWDQTCQFKMSFTLLNCRFLFFTLLHLKRKKKEKRLTFTFSLHTALAWAVII